MMSMLLSMMSMFSHRAPLRPGLGWVKVDETGIELRERANAPHVKAVDLHEDVRRAFDVGSDRKHQSAPDTGNTHVRG